MTRSLRSLPVIWGLGALVLLLAFARSPEAWARDARPLYQSDPAKGLGPEWSKRDTVAGKRTVLGPLSNETITLRLDDLPEHSMLRVEYDLWMIAGESRQPVRANIAARLGDGRAIHSFGFTVMPSAGGGEPQMQLPTSGLSLEESGGASEVNGLGLKLENAESTSDVGWRLAFTIPHHEPSLELAFAASGFRPPMPAAWALGRVKVSAVSPTPLRLEGPEATQAFFDQLGSAAQIEHERAMWRIVADPASIPAVVDWAVATPDRDDKLINSLIVQLDDNDWKVREDATARLKDLSSVAEPLLREARKSPASLEAEVRLDDILSNIKQSVANSPRNRAQLRIVQALSLIQSVEAIEGLRRIEAAGSAEAVVTLARSAADRLTAGRIADLLERAAALESAGDDAAAVAILGDTESLAQRLKATPEQQASITGRRSRIEDRRQTRDRIEKLQAAALAAPDDRAARRALLRALLVEAGDIRQALKVADAAEDPSTKNLLALASGKPGDRSPEQAEELARGLLDLAEKAGPWGRLQLATEAAAVCDDALARPQLPDASVQTIQKSLDRAASVVAAVDPLAEPPGRWRLRQFPDAASIATNLKPLPEEFLGSQSERFGFLSTWYIIGPFPSPDRKELHTSFPPEKKVDLKATLTGSDRKRLTWTRITSSKPNITPPEVRENAVWYAYAEFDSPSDRPAAVLLGADDSGKVWLNDEKIWTSDPELKSWQLAEGNVPVKLKKGVNRLLFRLENGHMGTGFSVCVSDPPDAGGQPPTLPKN